MNSQATMRGFRAAIEIIRNIPLKLTIFQKGMILVVVPLVLQVALIGMFVEMQRQTEDVNYWFAHTKEIISKGESLLHNLTDLETGTRGYLLTRSSVFMQPFDNARANIPATIDELRNLVSDNPPQQAAIEAIGVGVLRFIDWNSKTIQSATDLNEVAANLEQNREGKRQMDSLRVDIGNFLQGEERLDSRRKRNREFMQQMFFWCSIVAILTTFTVTFLMAFVFSRGIRGRLGALADNTLRLALGKELSPSRSRSMDEIGELDHAFRNMANKIQALVNIVNNIQIGLITFELAQKGDPHSLRLRAANPEASRLMGTSMDNHIGEMICDVFPELDENHLRRLATICETAKTLDLGEYLRIGESREARIWPLKGFSLPEHCVGISFEDITARKEAEQRNAQVNEELEARVAERTLAIRNREAHLAAILNAAADAIITIDHLGIIQSVNPTTERFFGYTAAEMMGQNINILMPAPYHEEHDGYLENYRNTGVKRIIGIGREVTAKRKDGSTFPVDLAVSDRLKSRQMRVLSVLCDGTRTGLKQKHQRTPHARFDHPSRHDSAIKKPPNGGESFDLASV